MAVYVSQSLPCTYITTYNSFDVESVWLLCRYSRMPRLLTHILIGAIYHPPDGDKNSVISHVLDCLDRCSHDHPNLGIILLGDFNQLPDSAIKAYPLRQVVTTPTRGKAVLDKIFTNMSDWYSTPTTLPAVGSSDHAAVLMLATHNPHYKQGTDVIVARRTCDNNSKVLLANALAKINWSSLYRIELCEDMTKCFYNSVNALFDEY